ncbi:AAA family ATPase [Paraburkholderia sp. JHI2823]|uniref:McrB family protein n=1 Tax=Paraburkholderia sp. JHI2823 TaxID=3112960 RepID=UPI0031721C6D
MSRTIPGRPNAHLTYDAARTFKEKALLGGQSLFIPDEQLWIPEHFEPLIKNYVENLIVENDDERGNTFVSKLRTQLAMCPPKSVALFAEIYWVVTLPSSSLKKIKLLRLKEIWRMQREPGELDMGNRLLAPETLLGVGSTGTAYNLLLWAELAYAIRLFKALAEMDAEKRLAVLSDPWTFAEWMLSMDETRSRQLYHILCHALFPDHFERIFSETGKAKLARHPSLGVPHVARANRVARDKALLEVRERLESESPEHPIDFYVNPPLLRREKKTTKSIARRATNGSTTVNVLQFDEDLSEESDGELESDTDVENDEDFAAAAAKLWRPRNRIFFGPPGSGKTRALETIRARRFAAGEHIEFVSFHPSYSYEDFVEGYRPEKGKHGRLSDEPVPGPFLQICDLAHKSPDVRHTLIIDEINRANVAKVFGELITLLEPSKRCAPNPSLDFSEARCSVRLQYSGKILAVPANLDIVASMNTADRSVQSMDRALRRRFEFIETPADPRKLPEETVYGVDLRALLAAINDRIEFLLDGEHAIGHAFLMGVRNLRDLRLAFSRRVIPLLQEYFFEDLSKAKLALTGSNKPCVFFAERTLDASGLFDNADDLDMQDARISIRPSANLAEWTAAEFLGLYLRGEALREALATLPPATDVLEEDELEDLEESAELDGEEKNNTVYVAPAANDEASPQSSDSVQTTGS